jgi:hypothetical protein
VDLTAIHNAKDNSFKLILAEHDLFVEFLRDFVPIDILKDVKPEDIEDMSERFLPLFQDAKDSDTIKRVRLNGNVQGSDSLFVIAVVEHESEVNHRSSFKMLQYITLVLTEYEKEANKAKDGASSAKDFKFPPVLPIVFYDGYGTWTAETNFLDKTEMADVFGQYIPTFEYELVALNRYSEADLTKFGDILSLIMLIDKIHTSDEFSLLSKLSPDYGKKIDALNIPHHLRELLANVITVLLARINIPQDEIEKVTEKIFKRRIQEMFTLIEHYDVQETRRLALKEMEVQVQAKEKELQTERERAQAERKQAQAKEKELRAERERAQAKEKELRAERERAQAKEKELQQEIANLMQAKEKEVQEAIRKAVQAEREQIRLEQNK